MSRKETRGREVREMYKRVVFTYKGKFVVYNLPAKLPPWFIIGGGKDEKDSTVSAHG